MQKAFKFNAVRLIGISLDFLLFALFLIQSVIIGCIVAYGYIPMPTKWLNQQLLKREFDGYRIQADSFRLKLWEEIELTGLNIYHSESNEPILKAASTVVNYSFKKNGAYQLNLTELVVTNGTLLLPAVYAPDGKRTALLESVTFHLSPTEHFVRIDSFAAKHEDTYLRGSIEWPTKPRSSAEKRPVGQFYQLIATALKEKARFSPFVRPTLEFNLSKRFDNSVGVSLLLSCEQLKHSNIAGSYFSIDTDFIFNEGTFHAQTPLLLRAKEIAFSDINVYAEGLTAHIKTEDWPGLFKKTLPVFEISAYRLVADQFELDSPKIRVDPKAFPALQFSGTTCGLKGSVAFSGQFNSNDKSGKIYANGSIDIFDLLPDALVTKLPKLEFGSTPYYDLTIDLREAFKPENINFHINVSDVTANGLKFDHILTNGNYREGTLSIKDILIDRENQWADGTFYYDAQTHDFRVSLLGSLLPAQYSPLLPEWWSSIFNDLEFDHESPGYGEFAIYGNTKISGKNAYFGHMEATNLAYKGAHFDTCELIVRGRKNYIELHNINATTGKGWATGRLGFTNATGPKKGLVSVRYDFDALLPIEVASKLLRGEIATILDNFELTELPRVQAHGVTFNESFNKYAGKNSVYVQAQIGAPLRFMDTPLDYLSFKLFGRQDDIYLRNVHFGYAEGSANAAIDISDIADAEKQMTFQLGLRNANQAKTVQNLPGSKDAEDQQTPSWKKEHAPARNTGLVDLNLHAKGPLDQIYAFDGYGNIEVRNEALGAIQVLGPLSNLLKNTRFSFTSFNLNRLTADFEIDGQQLVIPNLAINGPRTRISANGAFQLPDQALDMVVQVSLFANSGAPDSAINTVSRLITSPLPNLLTFKLTGTVDKQKIRSQFDPRNLIPAFN